jgi:thioredoxin 1
MKIVNGKEAFDEEISEGYTLVDFWAEWCNPCKMLTPILEELEKDYENIKFVKVNADLHFNILDEYKVTSIPHLIIFKDGEKIHEHIGAKPKVFIKSFIDEALAL